MDWLSSDWLFKRGRWWLAYPKLDRAVRARRLWAFQYEDLLRIREPEREPEVVIAWNGSNAIPSENSAVFVEAAFHNRSQGLSVRHSPVASLLAVSSTASENRHLGRIADQLVDLCNGDRQSQNDFCDWLDHIGPSWAQSERIALAAVLEAACRLGLIAATPLITWALENDRAPHVVSIVAAQRCRLLLAISPPLRARIQDALLRRFDEWQSSETRAAAAALPSVPYMGTSRRVLDWLLDKIREAHGEIVWAAVMALLDWACDTIPDATSLDDQSRSETLKIIRTRYDQEEMNAAPDTKLLAGLVWLMGAVATTSTLTEVAKTVVHAFIHPIGEEDAGALRAGRLLIVRGKDQALTAIMEAFDNSQEQLQSFLAALVV
jgi:hypothetical protein